MGKNKFPLRIILLLVFVCGVVLSLLGGPLSHAALFYLKPEQQSTAPWFWHLVGWFADLLPRIADALLIAPVLAAVVDRAAKENLLADFARDVSTHIIGRYVPRELRDHINTYLTVDIVRRDLDIVYELKEQEGDEEAIVLETSMTSDLHNYSEKAIETTQFIAVSKGLNAKRKSSTLTEVTFGDFTYREGDQTTSLHSTGIDNVFRMKYQLAPSQTGESPHATRCILRAREYFGVSDQTAYLAVHPVIGVSVTFIHPRKYAVELDLTFTQDSMAPPVPVYANGRSKWKLEAPILPGQGFFLKWSIAGRTAQFMSK